MFEVNHQSPTSLGVQPTADATTRLSIQARSWRQYLVSAALLAALFGAPAAVPTAAQVRPKSATQQQARPVGGKRIIRGTVKDDAGHPLISAHVRVKGAGRGSVTNANGQFSLQVPNGKVTIEASYIGMKPRTLVIPAGTGNLVRDIMLSEGGTTLGEAVITNGYQKIDPRNNTAAITSVKMDDILMPNMTTVDMALEGRIPDLVFTNNSGEAGATGRVRVRGTSTIVGNREPLWVLDGFVLQDPVDVSTEQLNDPDYINYIGNAFRVLTQKTSSVSTS